jgi:uncharacterized protein YlxW (UPF0749 family)
LKQLVSDESLHSQLNIIDFSDLICSNAERKSYGVRNKDSILYEDESEDALWSWEITNTLLLPASMQKTVNSIRNSKQSLHSKIKSLDKLITSIDKATQEKDLAKVVEDYEKYNKVVRKENALAQQ